MIFQFANSFVQMGVNSFDATMVAGNSAASNADALVYDVMAAFYTACGSFMGQNYGAGKKEKSAEQLPHQPGIFLRHRSAPGSVTGGFRKTVFVSVYQRCGSYGCRNVSSDDYGLFLLHLGIYGLYHCGSQSPGQKYYTDVHCHHGLLRIPCDLGLYGICVFSYDSVPVPAVYVFLEHYRSGGDLVFHTDIQRKNGSPVVRQRSHFAVSTRSRPARWCMDLCSFGLCSSRNGNVTNRQEMSAFQCHINGRK